MVAREEVEPVRAIFMIGSLEYSSWNGVGEELLIDALELVKKVVYIGPLECR